MITLEEGCVTAACVRSVWQAATEVLAAIDAGEIPTAREGQRGTQSITLVRGDNRNVAVAWPVRGEHTDPRVRALFAMLAEMQIGYW